MKVNIRTDMAATISAGINQGEHSDGAPADAVHETPASPGGARYIRSDDFDRDVWCVMGLPVDMTNIDQAVAAVDKAVASGDRLSFVTPNVNWLARAARNPDARKEIIAADLSLADGAPLAVAARLLGAPLKSRVAGSDLFEALRRRPSFSGRRIRIFFFGGRDGAAEAAARALDEENGALVSAGWLNPGYGDVESMSDTAIIEEINAAKPDFIVAALGAAKGQQWIERNKERLEAPVSAHLGAVVDFTAGGIRRAPAWARRLGLEWAWRIKEEPGLWRRYANDAAVLAFLCVTRLLPALLAGRTMATCGAEGAVETEFSSEATVVKLAGDFQSEELTPLRRAFRDAAMAGKDVILDFGELGKIDNAFLGLVLMLEKAANSRKFTIYLKDAGKMHKSLFAAAGMCYAERATAPQPSMAAEDLKAAG